MKAQTSIDPKLIALLGRKLYRGDPIMITVRELLQNSADACQKKGVDPEITITVTALEDKVVRIECKDNGCGMSPEEIVEDFLCLGGTSKITGDTTGGFGIAKAVIMSGLRWYVHTLDTFISSDHVLNGEDMEKATMYEGTVVTVEHQGDGYYGWLLDRIFAMLESSSVPVTFINNLNASRPGIINSYFDEGAEFSIVHKSPQMLYRAFETDNQRLQGHVFVRLNGLTQFDEYITSDIKSVIICDIDTLALASEKEYPFTMSRESLTGKFELDLVNFKNTARVNTESIDNEITAKKEEYRKDVRPGYLNVGKKRYFSGTREEAPPTFLDEQDRVREQIIASLRANNSSPFADIRSKIIEGSQSPMVYLSNYTFPEDDEMLGKHVEILGFWERIIERVVPEGVEYALGLTSSYKTAAFWAYEEGINFFGVNPLWIQNPDVNGDPIIRLFLSAIHECCHLFRKSHDEQFQFIYERMVEEVLEDVIVDLFDIRSEYERICRS